MVILLRYFVLNIVTDFVLNDTLVRQTFQCLLQIEITRNQTIPQIGK